MTGPLSLAQVLLALVAVGCASPSVRNPTPLPTPGPKHAARHAPPSTSPRDLGLEFHLVTTLPYPVTFAPLDRNALLLAGDQLNHVPLLLEGNVVQFRPELALVDDVTGAGASYFISAVGGSWPNNAWMALSGSSDAGPASSDLYRWRSGVGWHKQREVSRGVYDFVPLDGTLFQLSTFFSVPVMLQPKLEGLSATVKFRPEPSLCNPSGQGPLAPPWVHERILTLFGYHCDERGNPPPQGLTLMMESWEPEGTHSTQRFPVPLGVSSVDQIVIDEGTVMLLLPAHGRTPKRLVRLDDGAFSPLADLPEDFTPLAVAGSLALWGVSRGNLLHWTHNGWTALPLPRSKNQLSWLSLWKRGATDLWLLGELKASSERPAAWALFNTADGNVVTPLPTESERVSLSRAMSQEPENCTHPFADLLALTPFQLGYDDAVKLAPGEAQTRLRKALTRIPRFRNLQFRLHDCYGETCIGATFSRAQDADALRVALQAGRFARDRNRCRPPIESTPFDVER